MAGKADLVDELANKVEGITKKQAAEAFDHTFNLIRRHLKRGERVQIQGFGSFSVSKRAARKGRNPATGETIMIAASKNVRFKPGKELKDSVNR